jgi:hypothetical protein
MPYSLAAAPENHINYNFKITQNHITQKLKTWATRAWV